MWYGLGLTEMEMVRNDNRIVFVYRNWDSFYNLPIGDVRVFNHFISISVKVVNYIDTGFDFIIGFDFNIDTALDLKSISVHSISPYLSQSPFLLILSVLLPLLIEIT